MVVVGTAIQLAVRRARGETTRAVVLDGKCLRDKCQADHELGYELLKRVTSVLGQRLDATSFRLLDIYSTAT